MKKGKDELTCSLGAHLTDPGQPCSAETPVTSAEQPPGRSCLLKLCALPQINVCLFELLWFGSSRMGEEQQGQKRMGEGVQRVTGNGKF